MSEDPTREFTKDNPPEPGEGVWYRAREVVHAAGPFTNVKVGGKHQKGTGYIVDDSPLENKQGKQTWMDAVDFEAKYSPAGEADRPVVQGPGYDAHEASKEQATGYQMDEKVQGDDIAAATLQSKNA